MNQNQSIKLTEAQVAVLRRIVRASARLRARHIIRATSEEISNVPT